MPPSSANAKQAVREHIWTLLEASGSAPLGVHGRIPDFAGSDQAAARLAELPQWQAARVIKANPDRAQLPVRQAALTAGKLVYMAVPKLADIRPFFRLDPVELEQQGLSPDEIAIHQQAAELAPKVSINEMQPIDFVVCGTVAVNRHGVRIGKGAGYSDIELGLLADAGLISERTTITTTVHSLQVVDNELPHDTHDFTVDYIATPDEIIQCGSSYRPAGLVWENLSQAQIDAIPALSAR